MYSEQNFSLLSIKRKIYGMIMYLYGHISTLTNGGSDAVMLLILTGLLGMPEITYQVIQTSLSSDGCY